MAIEVPDTRGNGEPGPRRRAAAPRARRAAASAPPREPAAGGPTTGADATPVAVEPVAVELAAVEPVAVEPVAVEPVAVEPSAGELEASPAAVPPPQRSVFSRPAPRRRRATAAPAAEPEPEPVAVTPEPVPEPVAVAPEPVAVAPEPVAVVPEPEVTEVTEPVRALPATAGQPADRSADAAADEAPDVPTVVVRFGGGRYALDMDAVAEVGRPPRVTRVPGVPSWVAGVVNWRGRVLAVLDLRPLLAVPQTPLPASGRIVVLSRDGVTVGLLTERVEGVVPLDPEMLEPAIPTLHASAAALVSGQVTLPGAPVALLDLDSVFALRHQLPRVRRGA